MWFICSVVINVLVVLVLFFLYFFAKKMTHLGKRDVVGWIRLRSIGTA